MKHIPSSTTDKIEVLTFDNALNNHSEAVDYDRNKWIYVPDFYSEYRYILGTRGENPLICIGINPSTAKPDRLDNTLKSVERISKGNGFDGFIMFNVYAQRATDPKDMEKECNITLHRENMKAFEYVLKLSKSTPSVWAAWGTVIKQRPYLPACVKDMINIGKNHSAKWYSAGEKSKAGNHPHHPLYLKSNSVLEEFDVEEYIAKLIT